jgi:CBS domain-containing protein
MLHPRGDFTWPIIDESKGESVKSDIVSNEKPDFEASQDDLCVKDVMNPHVITVKSTESLKAGARLMSENGISCLPVVDNDVFKGLITQKAILINLIRKHEVADTLQVHDYMSHAVATIAPEISVLEASMVAHRKQAKWLPVLAGQTVVGIITQTDLVQTLMCFDSFPDVASIMSRDTIAVHAATSVAEAANIMAEHRVSCVVATQNGRVLGILTEKDLLKVAIERGENLSDICVVDTMSFPIISARPSDSMISASRLMDRMHIHHLAVLEDEKLCGIITRTDVLKAFQQSLVQYTGLYDLVKQS